MLVLKKKKNVKKIIFQAQLWHCGKIWLVREYEDDIKEETKSMPCIFTLQIHSNDGWLQDRTWFGKTFEENETLTVRTTFFTWILDAIVAILQELFANTTWQSNSFLKYKNTNYKVTHSPAFHIWDPGPNFEHWSRLN